ncbi:Ribosomal RNA methyltransferase Spb1, domain of unknown function DUF3381 [Dillenia turbinata]|uniref:Putative rRNA methyltransferase n=1 Tax=Dillenia turbinata TaxID=194707 RepID=A0AAN8YVF6_9MAGN
MGKVKGKHRLDKYYHLAKEHGYRSRAAYKLLELESKYSFLRSAHGVVDLCAAPGSWMQVAVQKAPVGCLVIGVDLNPIAPLRGAVAFQEDITKSECRAQIKRIMKENGCRALDVVLHDGSPNVGGAWATEAMSQNALVIDSVKLATEFLAPKGTIVTKVFRSQDYSAVVFCLKQLFEKVDTIKPLASRNTSAEIYVVGLKYKAPAKIDPRLLDVKYLFSGATETRKVIDVLRATKQKRHRDGYEDGESIVRKVCSASDFIFSETPLDVLGSVTCISFDDPACLQIKDHSLTTEEVKALCDDLRVLGKQDFKHLLKWRMHIRKALSPSQKAASTTSEAEYGNKKEEDEDEKMLNELEELTYAAERKKKRAKKLLSKRHAKDKARKATGMQIDAMEDGYTDQELFSLSSIKGKKDLVVVDSADYDHEGGDLEDSENEENLEDDHEPSDSDVDSDEERRRYDEYLEEILDQAYEKFVAGKDGSTKQRKRAKQSYGQLLEGDGADDDGENVIQYEDESDKDEEVQDVNPLMVPLVTEEKPTQDEITAKWFSQDIFAEAVQEGDLEKSDSEDEMQVDGGEGKVLVPEKAKPKKVQQSTGATKQSQKPSSIAGDGFEIVPAPATDSSDDSSDESDEDDIETKAEILACAKKMLRKKTRDQIIDDAYNKYMFDDDGLPKWFVEEEKRHRQPIKPATREEIEAMKAQFKEINARPAKKVAEAKARKKRVAMRKLDKARQKANSISEQADISDRSKRKMIEQLYKKAMPKRPKKELVVAKKGVQVKVGKGSVLVDRRMKKDARGMRKQGKGKGKKGNSKRGKGKGSSKASGKKG